MNDAANGMTNAITQFAMTGEFSVHSMVDSIIQDLIRMEAQQAVEAIFKVFTGGSGGGTGGGGAAGATGTLVSLFSSEFGGGYFANGLDYVPYDGFPAILHEGEKVTSRQDAAVERRGSGPVIDMSGAHYSFGAGVSAPEVVQAIKTSNAQLKADIARSFKTGRLG